MGFRYRKSFKAGPFRATVSQAAQTRHDMFCAVWVGGRVCQPPPQRGQRVRRGVDGAED